MAGDGRDDMQPVDVAITHAAELLTCRVAEGSARGADLAKLDVIKDGAVAIRDGVIVDVGPTEAIARRYRPRRTINARGRLVSPGFVDAHTHLVHAGSRHDDWEDRVRGRPSKGIGGGIRRTIAATRAATSADLRARALGDLDVMLRHGTTTVEAKSGYGLDRETELRLLSITAGLEHPVEVVTTYLGAHTVPPEYLDDRAGYVRLVRETLEPARQYAEYCDLACDPVSFTAEECAPLAEAAARLGFKLRLHADQTADAGGTALAVGLGASSVDHLDAASAGAISLLGAADTVGVVFPTVTLHMLEDPPAGSGGSWAAWARRLVESGATLALSTDYNPGSSPCPSMQAVMQAAARLYRLSYAEIWHMCTINAAAALDRTDRVGSLAVGKRANVIIWQVPEHGMVVHRFGRNHVDTVLVDGRTAVAGAAVDTRE